jgi:membrane protein DedA with SNARE-associated domain
LFEPLIDAAFDPVWNVSHQGLIWSTIVGLLLLSGIGLPIPEDLPLTAAGFTSYKYGGDQFVPTVFLTALVAVTIPILVGDLGAYALGRRFGFFFREMWLFRRLFTDARIARTRGWFDRYGSAAVFLGRQVAGVRFVTFYTAGTMRMSVLKFVLWDLVGCIVSVPVWLTLGGLAARWGREWLDAASSNVGIAFVVAVIVVALLIHLRHRASAKSA